ncbi:Maf family nucleotide pyrophosphatase [Niabella beijingensis]|uniref:Maf family nucleotide pyrophosphatase n=1 Tax=Niabella beijingensis TaxID=2872700 RepID=UPI001CBC9C4D|nr:Maf family nucleotide pyrophosphatase [Niabella beijingensis]MBZ4191768.1 Maf family nucleotide pyrophosphatase [Niabella beijingensis]
MSADRIILASSSPRRKQILEWADVPFEIVTKEIDEYFDPALDTRSAAADVARRKARAVLSDTGNEALIIAADTVVVLNGRVIGKPKNKAEAVETLTALQGNTHDVITGVALVRGAEEIVFSEVTEVTFHSLTGEQISYYIDRYRPFDKAGAYAIQEWIGVVGIQKINGDFYNVMGLPVSRILQEIHKLQYKSADG